MKKQTNFLLLQIAIMLLFCIPSLDSRRRRKVIPRFQPVFLNAKTSRPDESTEPSEPQEVEEEDIDELDELELEDPDEPEEEGIEEEEIEEPEEAEWPDTIGEPKPTVKYKSQQDDQTEQTATAQPDDQVQASEPKKDIFLNFEDADLKTFANYIGELKNINLIPDSKIAGNKISLTIRDPLTVEGAWNIFLTLLEMSKFSIVKVGDVHKIIRKTRSLLNHCRFTSM